MEMDYSNALGIEHRAVKDAEYKDQPVRIVSGSRIYSAEIEELWDAVTNSERIPCPPANSRTFVHSGFVVR